MTGQVGELQAMTAEEFARLFRQMTQFKENRFHPLVWIVGEPEIGENVYIGGFSEVNAVGARVRIGAGTFLNMGVMVAAQELVEIGDHCMLANGCFVSDASHRYDDPSRPITWQGFESKGPTRIGENCWLGANVVVTSGVTIGRRCVIGANSVVTTDLPPHSIAAGAPAKVLRTIEYPASSSRA